MKTKSRKVYLDLLKIISSFAVIAMHLCCVKEGSKINWAIFKIFNTLGNFAVPIFVMVSGALLLNKNKKITCKDIYLKYIPRVIISLCFVNFLIYIINSILDCNFSVHYLFMSVINVFINNVPVPYWYIYMLIGLYIITPILKSWINKTDEKIIEYYLLIFIAYRIIIYTLLNIPNLEIMSKFVSVYNSFQLPLITGYCGYYVLGYYLDNKVFKKVNNKWLWAILVIFTIITCALELHFSSLNELSNGSSIASDVFSINIFIISTLLFLCCKNSFTKDSNKFIFNISSKTYGIYLYHVLGLQLLSRFNVGRENAFMYVIGCATSIFIFSYICTYLTQKIPIIGKYFK